MNHDDNIRKYCDFIDDNAQELDGLALSFERTGNGYMGKRLRGLACQLGNASSLIRESLSARINDDYRETVGNVGRILTTLVEKKSEG